MNDPLKQYIQDRREEFDTLEIPEETFDKIMSRLNEPVPSAGKNHPLFSLKTWTIAASVTVIFSIGGFLFLKEKEIKNPIIVTKKKAKTVEENPVVIQIPENREETYGTITAEQNNTDGKLDGTGSVGSGKIVEISNPEQQNYVGNKLDVERAMVIELMNNQESASSRLQGIALAKNISAFDERLIHLLYEKAVSDENTNVRLAAVETLAEQNENPAIAEKIQQVFIQQDDPMVQKELIMMFASQKITELNSEVNEKLRVLAQDPETAAYVKDEAYAVLMQY
ncbi:HEAT repeat domain-containing protein [Chryseobacterium indologenes]|uniref:HEAT repeat domain-containing protein n=1 Tax=Chryseobacterium indologenes TaxID=253 RepID=A0A0N0ZW01_CHRID|nr:HEAT repeat domain-containing protein [Chryseobacterium indologenes]KPE49369.1 hypothetical protein AOB46_20535 [Chryseobacterium indologenes]